MHITRRVWRTWCCGAVAENGNGGRPWNAAARGASNLRTYVCRISNADIPPLTARAVVKGRDHPRWRSIMLLSDVPRASSEGSTTTANVFTVYWMKWQKREREREGDGREEEKKSGKTSDEKGRETKRDDFRRRFHAPERVAGYRLKGILVNCPLFIVFSSFIAPSFVSTLFHRSRDRKGANRWTRVMKSSRRISIRIQRSVHLVLRRSNDDDKGHVHIYVYIRIWEISISNQIKSFPRKFFRHLENGGKKMCASLEVSRQRWRRGWLNTTIVCICISLCCNTFTFTSGTQRERECNKHPITSVALNSSYRAEPWS